MTDSTEEAGGPKESRRIEQYPTVGPGLVVHWYAGSIVIEVDYEGWDAWVVTGHAGNREAGASTVVKLERR